MVSAGWVHVHGSTWLLITHAESKYSQPFFRPWCAWASSLSLSSLITEAFWLLSRTVGGACFMRHLVSCPTHWQTSRSCNCISRMCLERKFSVLFWSCICFDFCLSLGLVNVVETCLILNVTSFCVGRRILSVIFASPSGIAAGHQGLHLWFSCPN